RAAVRGLLAGTRDLPVRPVHGHHHDGGFMSWLWVIQAFLIAVLFLTGNYYLWIGMGRIPGAERFRPYTKWLLVILVLGAIVWGTPHTMIADSKELAAMGGSHHPFLGALGVMSAKNTAVNLMILTTFLSFLLYRRANTRPVVPWARTGTLIQGAMFAIAAGIVLFYGIRGYFVEAIVRIGFSVYQVLAVLSCILFVTVIDILMARGAQSLGAIRWGRMPPRSQYALFILAVTFTWLMGLMGFARSGIRQYWHVWQVMQDTSKYAATPALGYASKMISLCVLIFLSLVAFVFWLGGLAEKSTFVATAEGEKGTRHDLQAIPVRVARQPDRVRRLRLPADHARDDEAALARAGLVRDRVPRIAGRHGRCNGVRYPNDLPNLPDLADLPWGRWGSG